jgi:hypothetical protein
MRLPLAVTSHDWMGGARAVAVLSNLADKVEKAPIRQLLADSNSFQKPMAPGYGRSIYIDTLEVDDVSQASGKAKKKKELRHQRRRPMSERPAPILEGEVR